MCLDVRQIIRAPAVCRFFSHGDVAGQPVGRYVARVFSGERAAGVRPASCAGPSWLGIRRTQPKPHFFQRLSLAAGSCPPGASDEVAAPLPAYPAPTSPSSSFAGRRWSRPARPRPRYRPVLRRLAQTVLGFGGCLPPPTRSTLCYFPL